MKKFIEKLGKFNTQSFYRNLFLSIIMLFMLASANNDVLSVKFLMAAVLLLIIDITVSFEWFIDWVNKEDHMNTLTNIILWSMAIMLAISIIVEGYTDTAKLGILVILIIVFVMYIRNSNNKKQ